MVRVVSWLVLVAQVDVEPSGETRVLEGHLVHRPLVAPNTEAVSYERENLFESAASSVGAFGQVAIERIFEVVDNFNSSVSTGGYDDEWGNLRLSRIGNVRYEDSMLAQVFDDNGFFFRGWRGSSHCCSCFVGLFCHGLEP